eukprot:4603319-Pyramimonas_sp.AAC.1
MLRRVAMIFTLAHTAGLTIFSMDASVAGGAAACVARSRMNVCAVCLALILMRKLPENQSPKATA